jgi:hypothetical protein
MDRKVSWHRKWRRELVAGGSATLPMWRTTVAQRGKGEMKMLRFEGQFVIFIPSECQVSLGWCFG